MNVLLLSDFSRVAINATNYAMDLLQDHQVHFYLLNIYDPDPNSEENMEGKKAITLATMDERVQKLQQRSGDRAHKVTGHYSEDTLVNATRNFVDKQKIDLIVIGSVGNQQRHYTILGKHTFEILSKIKCNTLAVPEDINFVKYKKLLMPLDFTASFGSRNIRFLKNSEIFRNIYLDVLELPESDNIEYDRDIMKEEIFSGLTDIKIKFSKAIDPSIYDESIWTDVQNKYDLIILLGKNIRVCDRLLHNQYGLCAAVPNQLPILVLHD